MVLVTGGAGLVGRELLRQLLLDGKAVRAIFNKTAIPDFDIGNIEQIQCNILDVPGLEAAMRDIDEVYHCAALVTFNPARKNELFKVNIEGTTNVVNAALSTGVRKLVYVSSVAALGKMKTSEVITEEMNWTEETGNSNYGRSKYLAELEVWRGIGEGLEAVMVNPVIILGDGDWTAGSSKIFKTVYEEFPWYSEGVTGFVDVVDVVKAMIALMKSDITAERFIISAENKSFREIFNLIAKSFGKKLPAKKVSPFIANIVWRVEAIKSYFSGNDPLVTRETAAAALDYMHYDNSKLKNYLPGFTYRTIEETIALTCASMQQKLNKL